MQGRRFSLPLPLPLSFSLPLPWLNTTTPPHTINSQSAINHSINIKRCVVLTLFLRQFFVSFFGSCFLLFNCRLHILHFHFGRFVLGRCSTTTTTASAGAGGFTRCFIRFLFILFLLFLTRSRLFSFLLFQFVQSLLLDACTLCLLFCQFLCRNAFDLCVGRRYFRLFRCHKHEPG